MRDRKAKDEVASGTIDRLESRLCTACVSLFYSFFGLSRDTRHSERTQGQALPLRKQVRAGRGPRSRSHARSLRDTSNEWGITGVGNQMS
jgi:hypothetical protein